MFFEFLWQIVRVSSIKWELQISDQLPLVCDIEDRCGNCDAGVCLTLICNHID